MKHLLWTLLAVGCALALGCDDSDPAGGDADGSPADTGADAAGGGGGSTPADVGAGDAGDDPDTADPDMAVTPDEGPIPDMNVTPDGAVIPPEADAGAACIEGDACDENHRCHDEACRWDLRPMVFRMTDGLVTEPEAAAPELTAALTLAVQTRSLNLLFEPGYYDDAGGYDFYVGNGSTDGGDGTSYDFIHTLPIPRFNGRWRQTDDGVHWQQEEDGVWLLNIPIGTVMVDGEERSCFVRFPTTVRMEFWPSADDEGNAILRGRATGHLLDSDIDLVNIQGVAFRDFFGGEPPDLDLDGDGINDAYTFALDATAVSVPFHGDVPAGDNSNRDPEPPFENPAACDE